MEALMSATVAISYPPELPVSQLRDEIARAIAGHQVVVIAGETGSGKTTQLPKICLELGRSTIAHTQPRRIAARTIAERIAEELDVQLGTLVGYSVRFTDQSSAETRIRVMTDGILLAEIRRDRELARYDTIILDEAHERSLNIDFLIGYLKQLLPRRPDLKLIITSATIDVQRFAAHFADAGGTPAPIVEVSGRTYPVEIRYRPLVAEDAPADPEGVDDDDQDEEPGNEGQGNEGRSPARAASRSSAGEDRDLIDGVTDALDELRHDIDGDVLVFLSGEAEIRDVAEALRGRLVNERGAPTEVLPLYGRLSAAEQHRVFERSGAPGARRIVLATNVAETSLTVPGIRAVVDAGTARISRYSVRSKVQRLPIEAISQASANQRAGRAGRTSAGIAVRLYAQADFDRRPEFTDPEILRTNLAAVILQMLSLGLGDIAGFPFLQPPDSRGIKAGLDLLRELGALKTETSLTKVGHDLARLPVDPRFARMLLESRRHGRTAEVVAIVAGLTIQDPRERPVDRREQADRFHARFTDPTSDFLGLLNLWNHLQEQQRQLSGSAFRRQCRAEFLNFVRIREWQDLVRQLERALQDGDRSGGSRRGSGGRERDTRGSGGTASSAPVHDSAPTPADDSGPGPAAAPLIVDADGIHKSLLAGLLGQIGLRDDRTMLPTNTGRPGRGPQQRRGAVEFTGARQTKFVLFPGSALAKKPPRAVMTAELVETSRLFARVVAAIDPAWAEPIAGDLVKRAVGSPRWERKQGAAVADERVTLFGVPIVQQRRVQYARIDLPHARDLFLEHALVDGDWPTDITRDRVYDFDRANRRLIRDLGEQAERARQAVGVDEQRIFAFYDARIPIDVASVRAFETWWRGARAESPDLLTMQRDDLVEPEAAPEVDERDFPPVWRQGEQRLDLTYRFAPGTDDDGVTVRVPLPLLAGLTADGFDWQVPGFRTELVAALLKTLPKPLRRSVVPTADWARRLVADLPEGPEAGGTPGPLIDALARSVRRVAGSNPAPTDFDLDRLPPHLRPTFAVLGDGGRQLGRDTDLAALQRRFAAQARASVAQVHARSTGGQGASGLGKGEHGTGASPAVERSGLTTFPEQGLPRVLDSRQAGGVVRAYPALVDEGATVGVRLLATPAEQLAAGRLGLRRLLLLATPSPNTYVQQHLSGAEKLALAASPYPSTPALFDDCLIAVVDAVVAAETEDATVWTAEEFERVRAVLAGRVLDDLFAVVAATAAALAAGREADRAIRDAASPALLPAVHDARTQVSALLHPGFVRIDGAARIPRLAVYLAGVAHRLERLPAQAARDRAWSIEVRTATQMYLDAGGPLPLTEQMPERLVRVRWLLEELRLSLFAQHLGTTQPVSLQRIQRALAGLTA
ncbi:DUF3418 domain-containing protein [uncultured Amnibacterium sp.]|uniref:DUF3418 domain-containing protein n=1 Tax=uncultured Amnibacterium sp. TaxID=1631851 RepID=UPI0035C9C53F